MKVIEHLERAENPLFSYEIVPPPRGRTVQDIIDIAEALVPFDPPWIDVTSHSADAYYNEKKDGTVEKRVYKKRPGTIGICGIIQNRFKIDTVVHLLSAGFTKEETEDAIIELNYLGIHNVLALRGDAPNFKKNISAERSVNMYASDLVEQITEIKAGHFLDELSNAQPMDFCVGVAGYPEKHFESPSLRSDINYLKKKIDKGADYVTTQMFFDTQKYIDYVGKCRIAGIAVPIIPGIKIIRSVKQLKSIPRNFFVDFPDDFVGEIEKNPAHVKEIGINWAKKQTRELLEFGVPCVHFYIMNDTQSVLDVVREFR